jgi:apolipoprotein D and lipocalin family protein
VLDEAYTYAVIGDPSREYLWILSRTPKLDEATLTLIMKKLPTLGYDTKKLIWTPQVF